MIYPYKNINIAEIVPLLPFLFPPVDIVKHCREKYRAGNNSGTCLEKRNEEISFLDIDDDNDDNVNAGASWSL